MSKKQNMTEPFDITKFEPGQPGVYELMGPNDQIIGKSYSYWTGTQWNLAMGTVKAAAATPLRSRSAYNGDYTHFRGFKEKA